MNTSYTYLPYISPVYRGLKSWIIPNFYRGTNVFCPFCEKSFNRWLNNSSIGTCPQCGSASRHRLLYLYLEKRTSFFSGSQKVLHFAPEKCWSKKLKNKENLEYVTADLSAPEAEVKTDITDICFDSETFDVVLCSHVLEHIVDDRKAISELFRIVKRNGIAYIQIPYSDSKLTDEDLTITDPLERKKRYGQSDHVRLYGLDFQQRLEFAGFEVVLEHYARRLSSQQKEHFGVWDDVIFICKKQ